MALRLIPTPKSMVMLGGRFRFPAAMHIVLPAQPAGEDLFAAEQFAMRAEALSGCPFHISAGESVDAGAEICVRMDAVLDAGLAEEIRAQAYRLEVAAGGITLTAGSGEGIYYGLQTLLQIIREAAFDYQKSKAANKRFAIPCVVISDHPDFARRGVYHDTARGKVPTVETLLQLIDDLAHLKYNEFQLYIENNFQFRRHPEMYDDTDPFTAEEVLQLDAACRMRHMDFVPSLTSLGHFEKILSRAKYRHLAEAEPEQLKAMGAPVWHEAAPWSLCVTDPGAKKLLADMYAEFAPNFSSGQFNICCDEAYDLGRVRSKELADKIGTGQMYVDWVNFCDQLVKQNATGASIQMWGDIILNHPELIAQLPADATLLEWGYEHDHKFDEHCRTFAERLNASGENRKSFYVSPGTSSWLTLSARTKNACGNIHNAATAGLKYGARGILVTDWGDHGHQQMLSASLVPFAYGAAAGWNLAATPNPAPIDKKAVSASAMRNLLADMSVHLFLDSSGQFASLVYDLGLTYERLGWQRFNASLDHFLFREKWDFANYVNRSPAKSLADTVAATEKLLAGFGKAECGHPDCEQIVAEFEFTCREVIHTCQRTQLRQAWLAADPAKRNPEEETLRALAAKPLPRDFKARMKMLRTEALALAAEFEELWLARNKRSRVDDVLAEFQRMEDEYRRFA
ncbi:MAG TPA: beta-N-acetylhexosaminidase [Phycisphaerae bacterium]|nr:beta-N-acetylhexosaminidase [Phycisphaerae bacterium]